MIECIFGMEQKKMSELWIENNATDPIIIAWQDDDDISCIAIPGKEITYEKKNRVKRAKIKIIGNLKECVIITKPKNEYLKENITQNILDLFPQLSENFDNIIIYNYIDTSSIEVRKEESKQYKAVILPQNSLKTPGSGYYQARITPTMKLWIENSQSSTDDITIEYKKTEIKSEKNTYKNTIRKGLRDLIVPNLDKLHSIQLIDSTTIPIYPNIFKPFENDNNYTLIYIFKQGIRYLAIQLMVKNIKRMPNTEMEEHIVEFEPLIQKQKAAKLSQKVSQQQFQDIQAKKLPNISEKATEVKTEISKPTGQIISTAPTKKQIISEPITLTPSTISVTQPQEQMVQPSKPSTEKTAEETKGIEKEIPSNKPQPITKIATKSFVPSSTLKKPQIIQIPPRMITQPEMDNLLKNKEPLVWLEIKSPDQYDINAYYWNGNENIITMQHKKDTPLSYYLCGPIPKVNPNELHISISRNRRKISVNNLLEQAFYEEGLHLPFQDFVITLHENGHVTGKWEQREYAWKKALQRQQYSHKTDKEIVSMISASEPTSSIETQLEVEDTIFTFIRDWLYYLFNPNTWWQLLRQSIGFKSIKE